MPLPSLIGCSTPASPTRFGQTLVEVFTYKQLDTPRLSIDKLLLNRGCFQVEAAAAREEMKASRRDLLKLRNEDSALRALFSLTRTKLEQQAASCEQQIAQLEARIAAMQSSAAAEAEAAREQIKSLGSQLQAALDRLEAARKQADALAERHSAQLAEQSHEADAKLRACEAQLGVAAALLLPDIPVAGPITLRVAVTPMCSYVSGLGLHAHVPRFLRWAGNLALHDISRADFLSQISSIWSAKADLEGRQGALISLQAFLHQKFWISAEQEQLSHSATAEEGSTPAAIPASILSSHHARAAQVIIPFFLAISV